MQSTQSMHYCCCTYGLPYFLEITPRGIYTLSLASIERTSIRRRGRKNEDGTISSWSTEEERKVEERDIKTKGRRHFEKIRYCLIDGSLGTFEANFPFELFLLCASIRCHNFVSVASLKTASDHQLWVKHYFYKARSGITVVNQT